MTPPTLTVFTPTYNRAHTLVRTYESLCRQTCRDFEWIIVDDGSTDGTRELVLTWLAEGKLPIRYIYKPNGGLHTGYNTAIATMRTELNVCIDSDDFMPDNAVELIVGKWKSIDNHQDYAGIIGLDFELKSNKPIGGFFPKDLESCFFMDFHIKRIHSGDTKLALRTDLLQQFAPQTGFPGERNYNPISLIFQVCEKLPLLVINENLCFVEYQLTDSMSAGIYKQYFNSPRSFAKSRLLEIDMSRNSFSNRLRLAIHYTAETLISKDYYRLIHKKHPFLTLCSLLPGVALYFWLKWKTRN